MKREWEKPLTIVTTSMVAIIVIISFVLSYRNLVRAALSVDMIYFEAILWPLLIDLPLLVFTIAGLRAKLMGGRYVVFFSMVVLYSMLTMYFNAPVNHQAFVVYLVAPVSFILSFETLSSIIQSVVKNGHDIDANKVSNDSNKVSNDSNKGNKAIDVNTNLGVKDNKVFNDPNKIKQNPPVVITMETKANKFRCPVEGCDFVTSTKRGLSGHANKHRKEEG